MMGVPPAGRPPGSSSSGKSEGPKHGKSKADSKFKLPEKRGQKTDPKKSDKQEDEKDDLFDLSGKVKQQSQETTEQVSADEMASAKGVSAAEAAAKVQSTQALSSTHQVILDSVTNLYVGNVEGKSIVGMELKDSGNIPTELQGAQLQIETGDGGGIGIRLDPKPEHMQAAQNLIAGSPEQLGALMQKLSERGIHVTSLHVGDKEMSLEELQPPETESSQEDLLKDQEQGDEGGPTDQER